jgi:hypothetical protein
VLDREEGHLFLNVGWNSKRYTDGARLHHRRRFAAATNANRFRRLVYAALPDRGADPRGAADAAARTGLGAAAGDGALADALRLYREVIASDLEQDFLVCPSPVTHLAAIITNPPFNRHSAFIRRGLELLNSRIASALVLLFRHDHLQSESRTPPRRRLAEVGRAETILLCPWRPRWIPGTTEAPRWTFSWIVWRRDAGGSPVLRYARRRLTIPATASGGLISDEEPIAVQNASSPR